MNKEPLKETKKRQVKYIGQCKRYTLIKKTTLKRKVEG